ncbi:proline dehydrogenase 1, mitochondrial-like protein [Sarcoptes scabiei]|uniref:Proline dehydrogenase n=1 Tax=Sarcoptes scabiei TaxID=52283 RepID=A0A132A612_SARSC|nr:proline dehydrogenase 1, mitochondrial-like protein [Sarcoptes scabiei]
MSRYLMHHWHRKSSRLLTILINKISNDSFHQNVHIRCNNYGQNRLGITSCKDAFGKQIPSKLSRSKSTILSSQISCRKLDQLDMTFTNTEQAYRSKTTYELIRAIVVLYLSSFDVLVYSHTFLLKWTQKILGDYLFERLMKYTFYGQFVAGKDEEDIRPTLDHLRSFGVKSILDYSAEENIDEDRPAQKIKDKLERNKKHETSNQYKYDDVLAHRKGYRSIARTYFYMNEAQCEKNMDIFLKCIDAVAGATYGTGFAAIKLTALGRPELLLQLSEVIARAKDYFQEITGQKIMGFSNVTPAEFQKQLDQRYHLNVQNSEIADFLKQMDYDQRGLMNLFSWNGLIDMNTLINDLFQVPNLRTGRLERIINALDPEEEEMFRNMMRRIHCIAQAATQQDVRVLIDAEQTYFQPAINRITLELMRKYNKEKAIIFNTYQCYLKNAHETCELDAELSRRQNFYFGAKLVRGAYLEQERLRAKQLGYEDPINETFEKTTEMYEKNLDFFMNKIIETGIDNKKFAIMVASHNEDTVRYTLKKYKF